MKSYQIGRIEGRWKNFVPPIQGGIFLKTSEQNTASAIVPGILLEDDSDSSDSSTAPSPVFDTIDTNDNHLRQRKRGELVRSSGSSSATSLSSLDRDESTEKTPLGLLDQRTKQELDFDLAKYPSLVPEVQDSIVKKYRDLEKRMKNEGLFNCNYRAYAIEGLRYAFLFTSSMLLLRASQYALSGLFLGLFWHQLVFTAHDAGHMGITHSLHGDTVIGIIIADFLGGLSIGWRKRNHNVHHIVTNSPEHDPDIEHMPFFAISHRFLSTLRSTYYERLMPYDAFAQVTLQYQQYLYYPLLMFGRFNLYRLSWEYLILGLGPRKGPAWWHRWLEIVGQAFFWTWFGYGICYKSIPTWSGRLAFIMVSHMVTMPLHVQITLSHFAMSTADLGEHESFPQKMLRTTMDVDCPEWLDFFHGGLQFQAIHHLYPRMPRHNLRRAQKLVQAFCEETEIPYALYGFIGGNKEVIGRLGDVARQARILAECQKHAAKESVFEAH